MGRVIDAEHGEIFDVLAYVAFGTPPRTRTERAARAEAGIATQYPAKLAGFLKLVLSQYATSGVSELDPAKLPALLSLRYHHAIADSRELGSPQAIREAFAGFQRELYQG
jgi:type I restriction enzyme, R subunit